MNTYDSQPPTPTSLDVLIGHSLGSTVAFEATPGRLQASKMPKPTLSQEIQQLTGENGFLR